MKTMESTLSTAAPPLSFDARLKRCLKATGLSLPELRRAAMQCLLVQFERRGEITIPVTGSTGGETPTDPPLEPDPSSRAPVALASRHARAIRRFAAMLEVEPGDLLAWEMEDALRDTADPGSGLLRAWAFDMIVRRQL